jgi:hypothetical protein
MKLKPRNPEQQTPVLDVVVSAVFTEVNLSSMTDRTDLDGMLGAWA